MFGSRRIFVVAIRSGFVVCDVAGLIITNPFNGFVYLIVVVVGVVVIVVIVVGVLALEVVSCYPASPFSDIDMATARACTPPEHSPER